MIIVGLGNPGKEYRGTRHNVGFEVVNSLATEWQLNWEMNKKIGGELAILRSANARIFLLKPMTFMNRSGEVVRQWLEFNKLNHELVYLIHDDVDLELGRIKVQLNGGAGGHNGVKSVLEQVPGDSVRFRLGVGRPMEEVEVADWVLRPFSSKELGIVDEMIARAVNAVDMALRVGVEEAMNEFNSLV